MSCTARSLTDMETCYKVMRTDIARALDLEADRFDIEPEITAKLLRAGHRIVERPIRFEPRSRAQGKKIGWRDGVQASRRAGRDNAFVDGRTRAVISHDAARPMGGGRRWRWRSVAFGLVRGTWAAGGSDSSCYALMADAFARGEAQPVSPLARAGAVAGRAQRTFAPAGFIPSPVRPDAASPICAPGFALLLAPFRGLGGPDGIFVATPLAGALAVWLAWCFTSRHRRAARRLCRGARRRGNAGVPVPGRRSR